jgi:hypothetical protein
MSRVPHPHRQPWIVGALLMALVVRALIPAGFMPAASFSFQICPDNFPAHMLRVAGIDTHGYAGEHAGHASELASLSTHAAHHHHQSESGAHHDNASPQDDGTPHRHAAAGMEHCAFAAAAGPGFLAWAPTFSSPATAAQAPEFVYVVPTFKPLRFRVQQPRGPPALS